MLLDYFQFCPAFVNRALWSCRLVPNQIAVNVPVLLLAAVVPGGVLARRRTVAFCDCCHAEDPALLQMQTSYKRHWSGLMGNYSRRAVGAQAYSSFPSSAKVQVKPLRLALAATPPEET